MTFKEWMRQVDRSVQQTIGLSVHDLADYAFKNAFDAGEEPADVAAEVLAENGWEG